MKTILVDCDHTICDGFWRDQMLNEGCSWDELHEASAQDPPLTDMVALVQGMHGMGYRAVGLTSRPERFRQLTTKWASDNNVPLGSILMRPDEDRGPTAPLKLRLAMEWFGSLEALQNEVAFLLDDHEQVIQAFQSVGIPCLQVFARSHRHAF